MRIHEKEEKPKNLYNNKQLGSQSPSLKNEQQQNHYEINTHISNRNQLRNNSRGTIEQFINNFAKSNRRLHKLNQSYPYIEEQSCRNLHKLKVQVVLTCIS